MVELESLVGEHVLTGCDMSSIGEANAMLFTLDSITYRAEEDPGDDYRSALGTFEIVDTPVKNMFSGVRVRGRLSHACDAVLELVDIFTDKVVLEVGTDNADDYYPSYVACFTPENMAVNQ